MEERAEGSRIAAIEAGGKSGSRDREKRAAELGTLGFYLS